MRLKHEVRVVPPKHGEVREARIVIDERTLTEAEIAKANKMRLIQKGAKGEEIGRKGNIFNRNLDIGQGGKALYEKEKNEEEKRKKGESPEGPENQG